MWIVFNVNIPNLLQGIFLLLIGASWIKHACMASAAQNAITLVLHGDGRIEKALIPLLDGAGEATDETPAQQEGAEKNPARFAVDALQGGRARNTLIKPLRSGTVEQSTLSSPLQILAVTDGDRLQRLESASGKSSWETTSDIVLHPHTIVLPFLVILLYRQKNHLQSLILLKDSLTAEDFRQLRLWLRWQVKKLPAK
ncbi:MAG: hypothetical protein Q7J21_10265 [Rugosibacter sp.]|nr:hypothetical protein [Rugosibacter sp.]